MNSTSKLKKKFFIIVSITFILILGLTIKFNELQKNKIANILYRNTKENLILRNFRPVIFIYEDAINDNFDEIVMYNSNRELILNIKDQDQRFANFKFLNVFIKSINVPIYLDAKNKTYHGLLVFKYSIKKLILIAFAICLVFIIIIYFLFLFYEAQLKIEHELNLKIKKSEALSDLAKQVSHDIRSPLSALNLLISQLSNLPEDQRIMIRNSVNRITDIANTLLKKSKENGIDLNSKILIKNNQNYLKKELIPILIDKIVSEKRIEYRAFIDINIDSFSDKSYASFAEINAIDFQSVLSNLINNSIESFPNKEGKINIPKNYFQCNSVNNKLS